MIIPFRRGKISHFKIKTCQVFLKKIRNFLLKNFIKKKIWFKQKTNNLSFLNESALIFFLLKKPNLLNLKYFINQNFFQFSKRMIKQKEKNFLYFRKFFSHKNSIFLNFQKTKKKIRKIFPKINQLGEREKFFQNIKKKNKRNFGFVFSYSFFFFFQKIKNFSKRLFQNNSLNNSLEIFFFMLNTDGLNLSFIFQNIFKSYFKQLLFLFSCENNFFTKIIKKFRILNFFLNKNRNFFLINLKFLNLLKTSYYFEFLKKRILNFFFKISIFFFFLLKKNYFFFGLILKSLLSFSKKHKKFHVFFLAKKKKIQHNPNNCLKNYLANSKKFKEKIKQFWPLVDNTTNIFFIEIYLKELIEKKNTVFRKKKKNFKNINFLKKSFLETLNFVFQKKNFNILFFLKFSLRPKKFFGKKNFSKKFELILKNNDEKISIFNKNFFFFSFFFKWSFFIKQKNKNLKANLILLNQKLKNFQQKSAFNFGKTVFTRKFFFHEIEKINFSRLKDFLFFFIKKTSNNDNRSKNFLNFFYPSIFFLKKLFEKNPRKISIVGKILFLWNIFCKRTQKLKNYCSKITKKFNNFFLPKNYFMIYLSKKKFEKIFPKGKKNFGFLKKSIENQNIGKKFFLLNLKIKNFSNFYFKEILTNFFRSGLLCQNLDFKSIFLQKFKGIVLHRKISPWDFRMSNMTFFFSINKIILKLTELKIFLFQQTVIKKKKPKISLFSGSFLTFSRKKPKIFEMNIRNLKRSFTKRQTIFLNLFIGILVTNKIKNFLKFFLNLIRKTLKRHNDYDLKFFAFKKKKKKFLVNPKNYSLRNHFIFFSISGTKTRSVL